MRIDLGAFDEITLGRGKIHQAITTKESGLRRCELRLVDPWLSSHHARVLRLGGRWILEDLGSKNGCFVGGQNQKKATLEDGDLIELGHSFFLFRDALEVTPNEPAIIESTPAAQLNPLYTFSPDFADNCRGLDLVAASRIAILLEGETGTGKEVAARAIHQLSGRKGAFVALNCAALPRDLVEGELFGHQRGAFSGAITSQTGLVRAADGGTLFLDEVGEMPLSAQAKFLRVLQEREVRPLGATVSVTVDFRVVAATNRPLLAMVESGAFRRDLLARLSGHSVTLSSLRDRREDLGLLIAALLRKLDPARATSITFHPSAARALMLYDFPANIRELEMALGTALILSKDAPCITLQHLSPMIRATLETPASVSKREEAAKRDALVALLRKEQGNVAAVARSMGKARMQVQRFMKRYGIEADDFRT